MIILLSTLLTLYITHTKLTLKQLTNNSEQALYLYSQHTFASFRDKAKGKAYKGSCNAY